MDTLTLRDWQSECLEQQLNSIAEGDKTFFVAAGVGAGKTLQALSLHIAARFERSFVFVPSAGIRGSWKDDAHRLGLSVLEVKSVEDLYEDVDVFVMTNQKLCMKSDAGKLLRSAIAETISTFKSLVICDEAHHIAEDMVWGDTIRSVCSKSANYTVGYSGTPERSDDKTIYCLSYMSGEVSDDVNDLSDTEIQQAIMGMPSYHYDYKHALEDGHVAHVTTCLIGGAGIRHASDGSEPELLDFSVEYDDEDTENYEKENRRRLRGLAVECLDWQVNAFSEARKRLLEYREDGMPWGGLVACDNNAQLDELATELKALYPQDRFVIAREGSETEELVARFNSLETTSACREGCDWIINCNRVTEGISIDRLRVGLMLTARSTAIYFSQFMGRLIRLYGGAAAEEQPVCLLIPADQRFIGYAEKMQQLSYHALKSDVSKAGALVKQLATQVAVLRDKLKAAVSAGKDTEELKAELADAEEEFKAAEERLDFITQVSDSVGEKPEFITPTVEGVPIVYHFSDVRTAVDGAVIDGSRVDAAELKQKMTMVRALSPHVRGSLTAKDLFSSPLKKLESLCEAFGLKPQGV